MRILYHLILNLVISSVLIGQNDTIFPNNGAYWNVTSFTYDFPGTYYGHYDYELLNDSFDSLGYTWSTMRDGDLDTIGWVAADSGKVYFKGENTIYSGLGHEYQGDSVFVLYDYTKEIGDTIYSYVYGPMTILDIYESNFLGLPKRTFELESITPGNSDTWIEGMGSTGGFFRPLFTFFEVGFILCEFDGNYMDSLGNIYNLTYDPAGDCETLSVLTLTNTNSPKFGSNWIETDLDKKSDYTIYSISGTKVFQGTFPIGVFRTDLQFLDNGIYIIQIEASLYFKFIVI